MEAAGQEGTRTGGAATINTPTHDSREQHQHLLSGSTCQQEQNADVQHTMHLYGYPQARVTASIGAGGCGVDSGAPAASLARAFSAPAWPPMPYPSPNAPCAAMGASTGPTRRLQAVGSHTQPSASAGSAAAAAGISGGMSFPMLPTTSAGSSAAASCSAGSSSMHSWAQVQPSSSSLPYDDTPTCRICLDAISCEEFGSGQALRLGCRCSSGLDVMHTSCSEKWFRVRGSSVCEVCEAACEGLPVWLRAELSPDRRQAAAGAGGSSVRALLRALRPAPPSFTSIPSFLSQYALFCLLPATLTAFLLVMVYMRLLGCAAPVTMAMSILCAALTIANWVYVPNKPLMHILFVATMLGAVVLNLLLFRRISPAWDANTVAAVGTVAGVAGGLSLFYGVVWPITVISLYLCQECAGALNRRAGVAALAV